LDTKYGLVQRRRRGRVAVITALTEDGSGDPYFYPSGTAERYFKVPLGYFRAQEEFYRTLTLPAKALLLIALSLGPEFRLPHEKAKAWYGLSGETAQKGLAELHEKALLSRRLVTAAAPLAPRGFTRVPHYRLTGAFAKAPKRSPRLTVVS
jgi:hypothetical protein